MMQKDPKGESLDPAQITLLVAMIDFTKLIDNTFESAKGDMKGIEKCLMVTKNNLAELIKLTQTNLSRGDRQRVMCMITLDAHNRDIIEILVKENVTVGTDFQWQSKLRPKFKSDLGKKSNVASSAEFCICDAKFMYVDGGVHASVR